MQLSAFVDGELSDNEADLLVRRLSQDSELRQQVAEYLAIGRAMRGQLDPGGSERVRERIMAELGDRVPEHPVEPEAGKGPSRLLRPVGGLAVAATVALVAILGLRQTADSPEVPDAAAGIAASSSDAAIVQPAGYTVPSGPDDVLRQYYRSHVASSAALGANGINARWVSLQMRDDAVIEAPPGDDQDGETTQPETQATDQP